MNVGGNTAAMQSWAPAVWFALKVTASPYPISPAFLLLYPVFHLPSLVPRLSSLVSCLLSPISRLFSLVSCLLSPASFLPPLVSLIPSLVSLLLSLVSPHHFPHPPLYPYLLETPIAGKRGVSWSPPGGKGQGWPPAGEEDDCKAGRGEFDRQ